MDGVDRAILEELMSDAKIPMADLGRRMGIAPSTVFKRIEKLKKDGVIERFTIAIDPNFIEDSTVAFLSIRIEPGIRDTIEKFLLNKRQVREVYEVLEPNDFLAKITVKDISELKSEILIPIGEMDGVKEINTILTVRKVKEQAYIG